MKNNACITETIENKLTPYLKDITLLYMSADIKCLLFSF